MTITEAKSDEWSNSPINLLQLWKRQLSATHLFEIQIKKYDQTPLIWNIRDWYNISSNVIPMVLSVSNITRKLLNNKSVKEAFDNMISAKNIFQQAGGNYFSASRW